MKLEIQVDLYLSNLESLGRTISTHRSAKAWLSRFLKFCHSQNVSACAQLDSRLLDDFRQHLIWTPGPKGKLYSQNTLFQSQRMVRSFLKWLYEQEKVLVDLSVGWLLRRPPDPNRRIPTVEEVSRLLAVPDLRTKIGVRNKAILELLYGTGIRVNECYGLDLDSVDLSTSRIHIRGKGGKDRVLPMGRNLRFSLRSYLAVRDKFRSPSHETAFFVSIKSGGRLSIANLGAITRLAAKAAGLAPIGPHCLRHAFATHLLENGADLAYIQALLGHDSINSTSIYTTIRPLELLRTHRRTHPRAKRQGFKP